jgi:hypothetical protein
MYNSLESVSNRAACAVERLSVVTPIAIVTSASVLERLDGVNRLLGLGRLRILLLRLLGAVEIVRSAGSMAITIANVDIIFLATGASTAIVRFHSLDLG